MKPSLVGKLSAVAARCEEIGRMLQDGDVTSNPDRYVQLTREQAEKAPLVALFQRYRDIERDVAGAEEMTADPELRALAEEEIRAGRERLANLEVEIQHALLPRDPNDERNTYLEIRAGTGGDESTLFAGDLLRMYRRYAERRGWQAEIVSSSASEAGGFKEVVMRIAGHGAYSRLKFESGGHRVQRVPKTEAQGRIHTSACTVAVMPEVDEVGDVTINPADIRVDTFRSSGAGGQHINKTDSAVRITHLPTGIVVECQEGRSQHKNKAQALAVLAARIKDRQVREQQSAQASTRRTLIGSGDRSEKIRTYNFPQSRVTDHRINLTLYKIDQIMDGDIDELTSKLIAEDQADQLAALAD